MDTYINSLTERAVLGKNTLESLGTDVYKDILSPVCRADEGVSVSFKELNDEIFDKLTTCFDNPRRYNNESYIVHICGGITVYYTAEISKIYALYAVRRHANNNSIAAGIIYNTPKVPFRCVLTHLPGRQYISEYKKYIDMLLAFGHNTLMVEVHGGLEYKKHPEVTEGWVEYCRFFKEYNKKEWGKSHLITRIHSFPKNSIGIENADGGYLTHEEMGEIVKYCAERHMEIIPNVPTFSHADYILTRHPEFAECPDEPLPSNICPSNEDYYKLVYDIIDEVVEVFKPKRINIGHDEIYVLGQCPKCKGKTPEELIGTHIIRLHDYLESKNVKTMIWGDSFVNDFHSNGGMHVRLPWDGKTTFEYDGKSYPVRNYTCVTMEEWAEIKANDPDAEGWAVPVKYNTIKLLPKDLQIMNWYWSFGENVDMDIIRNDLYNVYGNFSAMGIRNFDKRISNGVSGVSYSAWSKSDLESLQRTGSLFTPAYNSIACWAAEYDESDIVQYTMCAANYVHKFFNDEIVSGKHLQIIHATDARIEHPSFFDGYSVVSSDYYIGEYTIEFEDGTKEIVPIYWGYNIGSSNVYWGSTLADVEISEEAGGYSPKYRYEPIGASKPIYDGRKTDYLFVKAVDKDVRNVILKSYSGYNIELKSWKVLND